MQQGLLQFVEGGELALVEGFEALGLFAEAINHIGNGFLSLHRRNVEHYLLRSSDIEMFLRGANDLSKDKFLSKSRVKKRRQKVRVNPISRPNNYQVAAI